MGQISSDELLQLLSIIVSPKADGKGEVKGKGELVIVGSGIAPLRQMSLETLQYIRIADVVYHAAQTAAEEAFIQMNAKESFDLKRLYGPGASKARLDSYIQMAEVMVRDVRRGKLVVGLFYGHPGVFAFPGHRAITIARAEGYEARMLPGISAEDNLYADIGVDPALPGCASFEASALVYHHLDMDTKLHNLIWQPGALGEMAMDFNNKNLHLLIDYLEQRYGPSFPVFIYKAGIFPGEKSIVIRHSIQELRDPDVTGLIDPSTTLYVPPKDVMARRLPDNHQRDQPLIVPVILKFPRDGTATASENIVLPSTSAYQLSHPELPVAPLYGDMERKCVAALDDFLEYVAKDSEKAKKHDKFIPGQYNPIISSPEMRIAAIRLAFSHHVLPNDPEKRKQIVSEFSRDLKSEEKEAMLSNQPFATERVMRARQTPRVDPRVCQFFVYFPIMAVIVAALEPTEASSIETVQA